MRLCAVNDAGHVIGQDHHRAKFSNHEIDLMIELHAEGEGLCYREIAEKFETSKWTVRDYIKGRRRGQLAVGQRRLPPPAPRRRYKPARPEEFDLIL